jgi:hypothetical protein
VASFEELAQTNPDIRQQADEWREARARAGEDAAWWPDFRQHVLNLGAPDPGEDPPDYWVGPDYTQPTPLTLAAAPIGRDSATTAAYPCATESASSRRV